MNLLKELTQFGLKDFVRICNLQLCQITVNTNKVAVALHADVDQVAKIVSPPDPFTQNQQLYGFITAKVTPADFLGSLTLTNNEHVVTFIEDQFKDPSALEVLRSKLDIDIDTSTSALGGLWFKVDNPIESFVGREEYLVQLHSQLLRHGLTVLSQVRVISGLGGVGKTQTARKYILSYKGHYPNVIWINAENPRSITDSFLKLIDSKIQGQVKVKTAEGKPRPFDLILEELYSILCARVSLLVFDNAESESDIRAFLPKALPPPKKTPFVLVTSRNQNWPTLFKYVVPLNVFTDAECIQFLSDNLISSAAENQNQNQNQDEEDLKILGRLLGGLPLALQQAVAFIREQDKKAQFKKGGRFRVPDYIQMYENEKERRKLLSFQPFEATDSNVTVSITWNVTLKKIQEAPFGQAAVQIIEVLSFLNSENIPKDLLFALFKELTDSEITEGLCLLEKYSMISLSKTDHDSISIHRQVQHVILDGLKQGFPASSWRIWTIINFIYFKIWPEKYNKLREHLNILVPASDKFLDSVEPSDPRFLDFLSNMVSVVEKFRLVPNPIQFLPLQEKVGIKFGEVGNFSRALELLTVAHKMRAADDQFGSGNVDQVQLQVQNQREQALVLSKTGDYDQALSLAKEIYQRTKELFGQHHPDTLLAQVAVGRILHIQGHNEEAFSWMDEALRTLEKICPDSLAFVDSQYEMVKLLSKRGKYADAGELAQKVHLAREKLLGPEHVETLKIQRLIVGVYDKLGDYSRALDLAQSAYNVRKRVSGLEHPDTLNVQNYMALVLDKQGRYEEALFWFRDLFEKRKKVLGERHLRTADAMNHIARVLQNRKEYEEALELYSKSHDLYLEQLGYDHPLALITRNNIASVKGELGQFEEAMELLNQIFEVRKDLLGREHADTLTTEQNMGRVLEHQGKREEAIQVYEQVLRLREKTLGTEHPSTVETRKSLERLKASDQIEDKNNILQN